MLGGCRYSAVIKTDMNSLNYKCIIFVAPHLQYAGNEHLPHFIIIPFALIINGKI